MTTRCIDVPTDEVEAFISEKMTDYAGDYVDIQRLFEICDNKLSGYMAMAKHVLNTPGDNQPVRLLICKEHNRVLAKYHLEELGLPMGITDYEIKKILPTKAQLAKCVADAER